MTAKACQDALDTLFQANAAVKAALGTPPRLFDAPVKMAAYPFAMWRRWETRPIDASGTPTQEHIATLELVSRQTGTQEARLALEALAACLSGPSPPAIGAKIILALPVYSDVMRANDGRTWLGILRLKVIAEPM